MAKRTKNRWRHPNRKYCFCFKRSDLPYVYTSVFGKRESTDLIWSEKNKEEALAILEYRVNLYLQPHEQKDTTTNTLLKQYATVYYNSYTKVNQSRYNTAYKLLLSKNHPCDDIEGIREDILTNVYKLSKKYSKPYMYKLMGCLRKIFDFGVDEGYLTRNPIKKAMMPEGGKKARRLFFTDDELNKLISYSYDKRGEEYGDLLTFLSIVGPRINEPLQGKKEDIDLVNNQMMIRDFKRANKSLGQDYAQRFIDIDLMNRYTNLSELLTRIYNRDNGEYYFRWRTYAGLERWLRLDMKTLNMYIPRRGFHAIRKHAINKFVMQGFPISVAAHIFGHGEAVMKKYYLEIMGAKKFKEFVQNTMKY